MHRQCKARKIKCGEQKPLCINCEKTGQPCDYSIKLNWDGRTKRKGGMDNHMTINTLRQTPQPKEEKHDYSIIDDLDYQRKVPSLPPSSSYGERRQPQLSQSPSFFDAVNSGHIVDPRTSANDSLTPVAQYARLRDDHISPYPSPVASSRDRSPQPSSKRSSFNGLQFPLGPGDMPPPPQTSPRHSSMGSNYADNGHKRARLSPSMHLPDIGSQYQSYMHNCVGNRASVSIPSIHRSPQSAPSKTFSPPHGGLIPPSPAASSNGSDDSQHLTARFISNAQPDRRMSIESLISGNSNQGSNSDAAFAGHMSGISNASTPKSSYGVDAGYPDLDMPRNDDKQALSGRAPVFSPGLNPMSSGGSQPPSNGQSTNYIESVRPFYKSPIDVKIPEELEPLPPILLNEPMNLLYFHHFISHTARILVPHDCSGNPFRKILPRSEFRSWLLYYCANAVML